MALLRIPEVAALGGGVDRSRVYDWIERGISVRGCPGRIRLEAVQMPGGLRVKESALERFLGQLQGARDIAAGGGRSAPAPAAAPVPGEDLVVVVDGITIFDGRPRASSGGAARAVGGSRGAVRDGGARGERNPGHRRRAFPTTRVTPG